MDWYYVDAGKQAGPVSEPEFEQLAAAGRIQPVTLVWHEGMANWVPLAQARPDLAGQPLAPAVGTAVAGAVGTPPVTAPISGDEVVCAQCSRIFPRQDTIQYGNSYVCAGCKPMFMQRLKEGAMMPTIVGEMNYAGFWIRFGAKLIDWLVLGVVVAIPIGIFVFVSMKANRANQLPGLLMGLNIWLQIGTNGITVLYDTFMQGRYGATLGKMACGLKVVRADGTPLTYGRSFGRAMAELLSALICYIGYIIAAFDGQKRALHDHIADTRVIRVR